MNAQQIIGQFAATGVQTCFHGRHINPQIYADLNGRNWSLKDYEARGGYQALRRIHQRTGGLALRIAAIATVCGVLAAVAPARRAARLDPAQAIRQ